MPELAFFILISGVLLLLGIVASLLSERLSVPALVLFLGLGMLAGSEGLIGIEFDSKQIAHTTATIALVIILFTGGLHAKWANIKPVLIPGLTLSTLGVLLTAVFMGTFAWFMLGSYSSFNLGPKGLHWSEALLLGTIVSSTDAAAVFSLFRTSSVKISQNLRNLLEFESGSNDPMAVLLATILLHIVQSQAQLDQPIIVQLAIQFGVGTLAGLVVGFAGTSIANRMTKLSTGLSPIMILSFGCITFGIADMAGGNGFLAVYIAGIVMGNKLTLRRENILSFHDGLSWLCQITMFIMLGLLVFPSGLLPVAGVATTLAFFLMFIARPLSVCLCMLPFKPKASELTFLSWFGLKGAVPIVLAIFPSIYGLEGADTIFNVIFFIVLISVLVQGITLMPLARWLCKKEH